jgi:hypothetical protein
MSDDLHLPVPRRNPKDIDLGRIETDLEFLIEPVSLRHVDSDCIAVCRDYRYGDININEKVIIDSGCILVTAT